jgi:hypothetical protein
MLPHGAPSQFGFIISLSRGLRNQKTYTPIIIIIEETFHCSSLRLNASFTPAITTARI